MTAEQLDRLAARAWDLTAAAQPLYATSVGDHRFDDRLPVVGEAARTTLLADLAALRAEVAPVAAAARADAVAHPGAAVTGAALDAYLDTVIAMETAAVGSWTVDPLDGPQVQFLNVPAYHAATTVADGDVLATRWEAMGPWFDIYVAEMRDALGRGVVSPVSPVRRVIDQLEDLLARPDEEWPLLEPLAEERAGWSAAERDRFADRLRRSVRDGTRPAMVRYHAFLVDELLPHARSDQTPGLGAIAGGQEAYRLVARAQTSLSLAPEEIHRIGLDEIARIDAELEALAARTIGSTDRADAQHRLRTDPALHFTTADEILRAAEVSLERANAAVPDWFGVLPVAACEVVEIPRHEAPHTTIAYYRDPAPDGSRPGRFYVNTTAPQTRPRYEAEALAFHESVPGHHLQVAIGQERIGLPAFRRFGDFTAYIEGWGLYTERLSDEMGLYSGDLDRIGVLSFDGWRACRLVLDTGMHALGWSRDQAITFMTDHTALAPNNIANEVDRYISLPGQALAYKLGQLELLRLRATARERLGSAFDIRAFHDVVLTAAALPLPVLAEVVDRWSATPAPATST